MTSIVDRAEAEFGEWLPQLAGALAILLLGLVFAWVLGAVTTRLLAAVGLDRLAERYGVHEALGRADPTPSVSLLAGRVVRLAVALAVVVAAVSALGIGGLEPALNELLLYVPRIVAAIVLVAVGILVGELIGRWVGRLATQLGLGGSLARAASWVVVGVFVLTALDQLGVPTEVVVVLGAILLAVAGLTAALAFGLGGRELAHELSAGRYVTSSYGLGDRIEVDAVRGAIVAFEPLVVVVHAEDGRLVRVPNGMLLRSVVTLEPSEPRDE